MTPYRKELAAMPVIRDWLVVDRQSPTGLAWRKGSARGRAVAGKPAGSPEGKGYYRVFVGKQAFKCHRLVLWLSGQHPLPDQLCDHIDRNKSNNLVENLRWVSKSVNSVNAPVRNKYGYKYVCFNPKGGRYRAQWGRTEAEGIKMFYVSTHDTPYEAHLAAIAHRLEHHWNP
jgi:hypothetical protein